MLDVSQMVGRRLEQVVKHDYGWGFIFSDDVELYVGGLWRLLVAERIICTSEDDGHAFGLPAPIDARAELQHRFGGITVTAATVRAGTVDMSLTFGVNGSLEVLATSAGYEAWTLSGPTGLVVGQPGYE